MVETILNSNWSSSLASVPRYGLATVVVPVVSFVAIKLLLLAKKKASMEKKPREWVFTQERDADGLPVLATAKARSSQTRMRRTR